MLNNKFFITNPKLINYLSNNILNNKFKINLPKLSNYLDEQNQYLMRSNNSVNAVNLLASLTSTSQNIQPPDIQPSDNSSSAVNLAASLLSSAQIPNNTPSTNAPSDNSSGAVNLVASLISSAQLPSNAPPGNKPFDKASSTKSGDTNYDIDIDCIGKENDDDIGCI